jgi:hypothetical protein
VDIQSIRAADIHPDRQAGGRPGDQRIIEGKKRLIELQLDIDY